MTLSTRQEHATHPLAFDNIAYLEQGVALLESIEDEHYAAALPPVFASSVGAHIRHILDHFTCLLDALASGRVDYDCRARDARIESDRQVALQAMLDVIKRLLDLPADDRDISLSVHMDSGSDAPIWAATSLTRELQFLTSHTIHHYALVANILGNAGVTLSPGFGISPSTLRHQGK